ncbi:Spo0E family sporulation regulatory protein-aspartic acid phosphatase [Fictibacillus iocasae]|uniref:Spo0E family sporulation regulatory protein-aspartic acid phosphatase n=1 Tax=Fictibacillus iocasae TaxID=2715437 RepID=A0ABW2NUZ4_9BACL
MDYLIELKRKQLIHTARVFGMTANETIRCSQELDRLLDLLQTLKKTSA